MLELHVKELEVFNDSQLVVSDIDGSYEARDVTMEKYLAEVCQLASASSVSQ